MGWVGGYISRPLTDLLLGSILYFKPDNSIHAPNQALATIGVGGEVGVGVCAGVAAAAGAGAARSISACKYAFELVYGHWSVHIAIENYSRKASRREQEKEKKVQGSLDCCCCSCCLVQWHVRLLFAMGSWPAFANGVANTICGRPRLDVRPGSVASSVRLNFHSQLAAQPKCRSSSSSG